MSKIQESQESQESIYIIVLIFIIASLIVTAYIINFYNESISDIPSNWGVLGDYLGGILNPIISFTALIYLVKAYSSQKQELKETRKALEETAKYNQSISETQNKQHSLMEDTFKLQQSSMRIDIHYKRISHLQDEINRASTCKYETSSHISNGGFTFYSATGEQYSGNREINEYISAKASEISQLLDEINRIQNGLN
ncbi:hypothetical protein [Aeromonas sp. MdU4]|uniref:hypothetical protein n=1 Tax=Aeromonas sp. MdU4 TaxID=3342819 RepID=UPI0035B6B5E7